jgi:hypothetical protein
MPKIDFKNNERDREVLKKGLMGLYAYYIGSATGYSVGQVRRRLKLGGVQLREYRSGGFLAQGVIKAFEDDPVVEREMQRRIRAQMKADAKAKDDDFYHKVVRLPVRKHSRPRRVIHKRRVYA